MLTLPSGNYDLSVLQRRKWLTAYGLITILCYKPLQEICFSYGICAQYWQRLSTTAKVRFIFLEVLLTNLGHPLSRESRRALVIVSKLLQNLVAGVEFDGTKEGYMTQLNDFIKNNAEAVHTFVKKLTVSNATLRMKN